MGFATRAVLFLVSLSGLAAQSGPDALFDQARVYQQAGRWAEAEQTYRAYLKRVPNRPEALANLGAVLVRQDKFEEAVASYRQSLALAPKLAPIHLNLGLAYLKWGRKEAAVDSFTAYLAADPSNRQARQLRAVTRLELDRFSEALEDFQSLLPSDDITVHLGIATCHGRMGRGAEARQALEPYLARNDSAEVQFVLGQALLADDRLDESLAALKRAAAINPKLPTLHLHLGAVHWRRKQTEEAIGEWRQELALFPDSFQAHYTLGAALALSGSQEKEAPALLRRAVALRPRSAPALYQLAKLIWQQTKSQEAASLLERSIQSDPKYREAHYLLANVYQSLGRRQEAAREFAIVKKISQEDLQRNKDLLELGKE